MRPVRISGLLTLAAIPVAGSMVAMKTEASAAEAGAILPVMSCEALANSDFTALDGSHHLGRDSDAQRSFLLRRQRLHQPYHPVRGALAHGDLARRLSAAGLRRAL